MARKTWAVGDVLTASDMNQYVTNAHQALSASEVPLIVQGAASQTADLAEFQDSTGVALAKITSAGDLTAHSVVCNSGAGNAFGGATISGAIVAVHANSAGAIPLIVEAAASQTADMTQWLRSDGVALAKVESDGTMASLRGYFGFYNEGNLPTAALNALANSVGEVVLAVRGYPGQTANLTEWQADDTGAIVASVDAHGKIIGHSGLQIDTAHTGVDPAIEVTVSNGAYRGITVRAASGQSTNLTEWYDQAGTLKARADGAGNLGGHYLFLQNGSTNPGGSGSQGYLWIDSSGNLQFTSSGGRVTQLALV